MIRAVAYSCLLASAGAKYMDCGDAPLCGVLVLESGDGSGNYHHDKTVVHGIWPQVAPYGNSKCIKAADQSEPQKVHSCYAQDGESTGSLLGFERHEWDAHGKCAGTKSESDFFDAVCNLSATPLQVMQKSKDAGGDVDAMNKAIVAAGYEVFQQDSSQKQLYLSVCADSNGFWKTSAVKDFSKNCGGTAPGPAPGPAPSPSGESCEPGAHGPKCSTDDDCTSHTNCLRCASSGYCTMQPKQQSVGLVFA